MAFMPLDRLMEGVGFSPKVKVIALWAKALNFSIFLP
jgi:hypothetical protein